MGSDYKIDGRDFYSGWDVDSFDEFAKKISNGEMQTPSDKGFGNKCISFFIDNKGYTEEEAKSACYAGIIRQYKDKQMKESFASDDQQLVQPQGGTQVGQGKLNPWQQKSSEMDSLISDLKDNSGHVSFRACKDTLMSSPKYNSGEWTDKDIKGKCGSLVSQKTRNYAGQVTKSKFQKESCTECFYQQLDSIFFVE